METKTKAPVIIELDDLDLANVVGGAGSEGPDLTPSRCPKHRTVDEVSVALTESAAS